MDGGARILFLVCRCGGELLVRGRSVANVAVVLLASGKPRMTLRG